MFYAAIVFLILLWIFGRYTFAAIRWIFLLAVLALIGAFILAQFTEPATPTPNALKLPMGNNQTRNQ